MASWKILLFPLILAILFLKSFTSAQRIKRFSDKHLNDNFLNIQNKFESVDKQMEQLASKGNYTFDVHEIIANVTRLIIRLNDENAKKFEEKFKNFEKIDKNFKKLNKNFEKIDKFFEKTNNNFEKIEIVEAKLVGMELILLQLKNTSDLWRGVTSQAQSTCEDKVATWANATSIQPNPNSDQSVQKMLNVCLPNPCQRGGRCQVSPTGNQYVCNCPKRTLGIHCENEECSAEKRCFRYKDTLYVVVETRLTWAEAKVKCEGLNMTLAMPKDEESNRFLYSRLKPIYTTHPYYYPWIGLKRNAGMSKGTWAWLDGSALGEYMGGHPNMKSETGSLFGVLNVGGDGTPLWWWDSATTQLYSICETRLFAN